MIKISEDIKKLYIEDSTPIELEVRFKDNVFPTINGSDVLSEQMTLHESICEEEQLKFGGCNASSFELTVFNLNSGIKGYEIEPVLITNKTEIPLGVFYVETIEKYAGKDYKKLTAYDKMRYFDVDVKDWYDNLTFPISVKNFRDGLCEYVGVEQNEVTLITDNIMLTKELDSSNGINGLSLMKQICEISGVFGRMDRYGKFDYLSLESSMLLPADDLYPANDLYPSAGSGSSENSFNISTSLMYEHPLVEDFFTSNIDGVIIVDSEGAQVLTEYNQNPYYVQDNFVIMGQTHETIMSLANALLSKMSSISYRPINSSKIKGQPHVECGDFISGEVNGYGFEAYVFQRDLTGIKALRDAYICKGKEMLENDMNGVTAQLQRLNKTTERIKTSVQVTENGLESEVKRATGAENELLTKVTQTEKSITLEVKRATDAENELSTRIEQTEQQIVLRVDSATGKIVQVSLIGDTGSGTEFKVDADNINLSASDVINLLSGGDINLTGKNITITSDNFNADKYGNLKCASIKITGGNIEIVSDGQIFNFMDLKSTNTTVGYGEKIGTSETRVSSGDIIISQKSNDGAATYESSFSPLDFALSENGNRYFYSNPSQGTYADTLTCVHFNNLSSKKMKENIFKMDDADANKLMDVDVVSFDYKEEYGGEKGQFGVIAEDAEKIYPHIVNRRNGEVIGVDYTKFIPFLIKKIQMQDKEISSLKAQIGGNS